MASFRKIPQAPALRKATYNLAGHITDHTPRTVPASLLSVKGRIATVQIEANSETPLPQLTVPLIESEYIRTPLQTGCKGLLIGTSINVDFLAQLNTQRPDITDRTGTLTSAAFIPLASATWQELDRDTLNLYGVTGVEMTDRLNGNTSVTLTEECATVKQGDATIVLAGGKVSITGDLIINGQPYKDHTHSNGHNGAPTGGVMNN